MTSSLGGRSRARDGGAIRNLLVGGVRVRVATAAPAPGESLSIAARTLGERLVSSWTSSAATVRVAALLPSGRPIVTGPHGASGIVVSLAHDAGLVAAAVAAGCGVGIDVVDDSVTRDGLLHWMDAAERDLAARTSPGAVWGAKEAAYKACSIDAAFDPRATRIAPAAPGRFRWSVRDRWRTVEGEGRFVRRGRHVVAVAVVAVAPVRHAPRAARPPRHVPGAVACGPVSPHPSIPPENAR